MQEMQEDIVPLLKPTPVVVYRRKSYYDVTGTIKRAGLEDPQDFDSSVYNIERINATLQRNADVYLINDGPGVWYVRITHDGIAFTNESPLYEGESKLYRNVYEVRHRAPVVGLKYRITENPLKKQKNIEYFSGNPYISETFIANTGLTNANIEDIKDGASTINGAARDDTYQALRRNAHSGELANLGPGTIFVSFDDGNGFSNERTIPANNSQDLGGMDIARLRLRTDIINTQYRLAAQ